MTRAVFFLSTIPCKFVGQIGYISNLLSDKFLVCNKKLPEISGSFFNKSYCLSLSYRIKF